MNNNSEETLCRVEQNDDEVTELWIGYPNIDGEFLSSDAGDYSRLGAAIGNNTHLTKLWITLNDEDPLDTANTEFFNGLKRNSSIKNLALHCRNHVGGIGHEILKVYQKINNNLTCLSIYEAVLDNGGDNVIIETLRWCRHLKMINLERNSITDEQLLPMIEAIKGHSMLEKLYLYGNRIGNAGCHALATLLADINYNILDLDLDGNQIGNDGANAIANSLANNTKLMKLDLEDNPIDASAVGIFCRVLCNTSSVNDTYLSNHTLKELLLSDAQQGQHANLLSSLLTLNSGINKSHVAIRKILKYHPNIDMKPFFEWDADGEQTLKALPYVIDWFERAREAVAGGARYDFEEKKLTAIFKFAKAMPILFVPATHGNGNDKKRKREVVPEA